MNECACPNKCGEVRMDSKLACKVSKLIAVGRFGDALEEWLGLNHDEMTSLIYNHQNLRTTFCAYAFTCYLLHLNDSEIYHSMAYTTLFMHFVYLVGSEHVQLYHLKQNESFKLDQLALSNVKFGSYRLPENAVSDYEAYNVAQEMLVLDPNNAEALEIVKYIKEAQEDWNDYSGLTPEKAFRLVRHLQRQKYFFPMPMPQDILLADAFVQATSLVLAGRLIEAKKILFNSDIAIFCKTLPVLAEKTGNLSIYTFIWLMMREKETALLHICAAEIAQAMAQYLIANNYTIEGIEQLVFFHFDCASRISPDDLNLHQKLLKLYEITPKSFKNDEVLRSAQKILNHNPGHELAQKIVLEIK